jgi:hypothetical protein
MLKWNENFSLEMKSCKSKTTFKAKFENAFIDNIDQSIGREQLEIIFEKNALAFLILNFVRNITLLLRKRRSTPVQTKLLLLEQIMFFLFLAFFHFRV